MENIILIGQRIKECRLNAHMTQDELGNLLGLNKSTIQRYETGKIENIKVPVLHAMAKAMDVNPDYLALKSDSRESYYAQKTITETTTPQEDFAKTEDEKKILLLARHLEKIPREKRDKIIHNFEDTIDTYLDAMGIKRED